MLASTVWISAVAAAVLVPLITALGVKLGKGTKLFPRLPEPDPDDPPQRRDRTAYFGANALALAIGAVAALALVWLTASGDSPMRFSPFDGAGRWLGPFFVFLGVGAALVPTLLRWLVPAGPLLHLLHKSGQKQKATRGLDWRPATRLLGLTVALAAVLLHFGLRIVHTTFAEDVIVWRDFPWQAVQGRSYDEVADVRIIRTKTAMTGRVVERPHLGVTFADGTSITVGSRDDRPAGFWEKPAAFVAERAGVEVRRVEGE
jgi:hypothetical protein